MSRYIAENEEVWDEVQRTEKYDSAAEYLEKNKRIKREVNRLKQTTDSQLYLQMSQKQTQAMKILIDCMPKNEKKSKGPEDDFDNFVNEREDV